MQNRSISSVAVCGAGTMGSGIAQVCAAAGYPTVLYDLNNEVLKNAQASIQKLLSTLVAKGKLTTGAKQALENNLRFTTNLQECTSDLVIEAIIEKPQIKTALFNELASINDPNTIFASNTSSLSLTTIAKDVQHPERVAGLHFFNPAPLMKLVEVVKGDQTSDEIINTLFSFTQRLGKTPVVCKDAPGFIVNRVARPYYIEALRLAEEGMDMQVIDALLENRGFKLGPFKLMDLIGNDINYAVSCSVYEQLGAPERLKPSYIQKEKVDRGELGKKTGKGYYSY